MVSDDVYGPSGTTPSQLYCSRIAGSRENRNPSSSHFMSYLTSFVNGVSVDEKPGFSTQVFTASRAVNDFHWSLRSQPEYEAVEPPTSSTAVCRSVGISPGRYSF